ncbi:hypothetical protein QTO34_010655 [Cnephaeus nilssonii]|uniref:Uncharacterized protein n=1 Tax=Cnephaeus nilssonii TaxID=3371016 RepID=A0AA40LEJ5_CNENI|nr:hypothetical protein QTO34_010655 [Eptesicus nilssonii]
MSLQPPKSLKMTRSLKEEGAIWNCHKSSWDRHLRGYRGKEEEMHRALRDCLVKESGHQFSAGTSFSLAPWTQALALATRRSECLPPAPSVPLSGHPESRRPHLLPAHRSPLSCAAADPAGPIGHPESCPPGLPPANLGRNDRLHNDRITDQQEDGAASYKPAVVEAVAAWRLTGCCSNAVVGKPRLASHMRLFGPLSVALPQNTTCGRTRTVRLKLRGPCAEVGFRPGRVYFEEVVLTPSHTQGAKEPYVARQPRFADHCSNVHLTGARCSLALLRRQEKLLPPPLRLPASYNAILGLGIREIYDLQKRNQDGSKVKQLNCHQRTTISKVQLKTKRLPSRTTGMLAEW